MSKPKTDHRALLPVNATIVEFGYEPHVSFRLRIAQVPAVVKPGENVPLADVVFRGLQALDVSLDLRSTSSSTLQAADWKAGLSGPKDSMIGVYLRTNTGSINLACDSVQRNSLVDILVGGEAKP